jgi:hypothetical protein
VLFDDLLADREADAGAGVATPGVKPLAHLEDPLGLGTGSTPMPLSATENRHIGPSRSACAAGWVS